MTTRRIRATGPLLLLIGLALGLVLAGPAGASEPGPAYPPGAGADDVVQAGRGAGRGGMEGTAPAGAADDGGSAGSDPASGSDGAGGAAAADDDTEVGDPATEERPDDPAGDDATDENGDADDEEVAADAAASGDGTDDASEPRVGPILVVVGTAILLGAGVVAIARRI